MATQEIVLPITGMTCASCVATIEGALSNLNGVEKAAVNLGGGKAKITYDPARTGLPQFVQAVTDVGYEIGTEQVTLQVSGMTCASCVAHVEGALTALEGVTKAVVNLGLGTAKVDYIPGLVTVAQMKRAVREVGYSAEEKVEGVEALDREKEARQREIRRQGLYLAFTTPIALLVMLGTFRDYWILPQFVPEWLGYKWVLGLLTTPVVLGPGRQFFVNSWRGLRHGVTDRNLAPYLNLDTRLSKSS